MTTDTAGQPDTAQMEQGGKSWANHGRISANDYTDCLEETITHQNLEQGSACPACAEDHIRGILRKDKP